MNKPIISENFNVNDIHKIREYHYELTKNMSVEERNEFIRKNIGDFLKKQKEISNELHVN
jgi:hypothetical protein